MNYQTKLLNLANEIMEFVETEFDVVPDSLSEYSNPKYYGGVDYFITCLLCQLEEIQNEITPTIPPKHKPIPQGLRTKVYERDKYQCCECKKRVKLSIDHVKPRARGGTDDIGNLRTLCKICNSKKGMKTA